MQTNSETQASPFPLKIFLLVSPFLFGGFYEALSCLFSVFLIFYLMYCQRRNGRFYIYKNLPLLFVTVLTAAYFFSPFWAADKGMAILGFFKFLPFLLFSLAVMQIDNEKQAELFDTVPISGAFMALLSFGLGQIPFLENIFFVNSRLAGFFQYPNTFALFLLAGVFLLIGKQHFVKKDLLNLAILFFGIAQTGSRTVFFILLIFVPISCIFLHNKKIRRILIFLLTTMLAVTILYTILTGNTANISRYLTASFSSSTFLGRLLYFKDAIPVILSHPLGLGYTGYYSMQGSFQTGVYSVLNIHNEFLQLLLDVGWIPALVFIAALFCAVFCKNTAWNYKLMLCALIMHCMFDFDLQFVVIGFLLLTAMDLHAGTLLALKRQQPPLIADIISIFLLCANLWFGAANAFYYFGNLHMASHLYPGYTKAWLELLPETENIEQMNETADKILSLNSSSSLAYSAKARAAYSEGDFEHMIIYKKQAISLSKYVLEEYLDYFDMLLVGIRLYTEHQDQNSALYCYQCLTEIPSMLEQVLDNTDSLAWKISDQPKLALPDKYQEILSSLQIEK